jgi:hypothetical protein
VSLLKSRVLRAADPECGARRGLAPGDGRSLDSMAGCGTPILLDIHSGHSEGEAE